ncbi:short-chain dehydrogenase/reductase family protein, putative [Talaromyces stipitatus ATCC 10500]|uniref:Short-chain dehydrogenase/reductase family protein, putative n=1 Tax=Talaromyces stipitatus (strain ATCC 10500 / CBS 375.48 / QM 6759 / NRRL 1006) TaxID=441959 RepID=B8M0G5_TALSN|nr:short-chain dehydrogenase/reductase family protein, putative [Talaromyces stipitatus ATCC 10500]EED21262.1 short-chain dehydrogenase/reductase family protein, putative [Talaromyces stipitatus ATCC 10500]
MSNQLEKLASFEASNLGFIWRQFTRPKPLPAGIRLNGNVAIVTGSNTGLGLSVSRQLLDLGLSHLVMAVRSVSKGEAAAVELREKFPKAIITVWFLDMGSYDSIRAFAAQCGTLQRIDIAILNAGLMQSEYVINPSTQHEVTLQVNYLSTALLAIMLLPKLKASRNHGGSRPPVLSIVGSDMMYSAKFKTPGSILAQFQDHKTFDGTSWYAKSKILQMFFVSKLVDFVSSDNVLVNVSNPGMTAGTSFFQGHPAIVQKIISVAQWIFARSADVGATAYLDAVLVRGNISHGSFASDWTIKPYPKLFYTKCGDEFKENLWQETMDEFKFLDAWKIVNDLKEKNAGI